MFSGLFSLPFAPADRADVAVREPAAMPRESWIAGGENAVVRSLASAVLARDLPYNPIVLYGAAGAWKSSLANRLADLRRQQFRLCDVIETTGVELARALGHAVEATSTADLRATYHRCDLLVVDDVHQLAGKRAAQEFLVAAIEALTHRGSLSIITLRQPPAATPRLYPQLVSRLMSGCVVALALPGPLARQELVRQTAAQLRLSLSESDVSRLACCNGTKRAPFLTAGRLRSSVLRLAAADDFADPVARSRSQARPRSRQTELAEVAAVCRQVTVAVGKHFGLTLGELKGKSRRQAVADARALAMYIARQLTGASYAEIGRQFGKRDHTTVLHACQKLTAAVDRDCSMRQLAEDVAAQIVAEDCVEL